MRPSLPAAMTVIPYLEAMDRTQTYSNFGPLVKQLEHRYAELLGVASGQVVTTANATLGIAGAICISSKSKWTIPAWTFPATALAALLAGRRPSFADIALDTWTLTELSRPIRGEDRGRLPVIPFGANFQLSDFDLDEESLIIDAAASLGNLPSLHDLPESWAVIFSLHATKVLGCGEGGLAVFGSIAAAERFRAWSNFGFSGSRIPSSIGTNAKMSEIAAAYALAALDQWPAIAEQWATRLEVAGQISASLGFARSPGADQSISPYWIGVFQDEDTRCRVEEVLASKAVSTRRWWPQPLTESSAFAECSRESVPNSDLLSRITLGLPMHLGLTAQNFDEIANALARVL